MEKGIKDITLQFLNEPQNITAALATATGEMPHASVIYYAATEELSIYFLTATSTQKYKDLLQNPNAALSFGFGPAYTTVQTHGETALLEKGSEEEALAINMIKKRLLENGHTWPIFQLSEYDDDAIVVFKFTPSQMYFLNLEKDSSLPVSTEGLQTVI